MLLLDDVAGELVPHPAVQGEEEGPHVEHRVALQRPGPGQEQ